MIFYGKYVTRFPDEPAHVSYIAYLESTHKIIPDFKSMTILTTGGNKSDFDGSLAVGSGYAKALKFSSDFNYLCHPPLYYHIMRLSGGVTFNNGVLKIDIYRLRAFSMVLAAFAMALVFYIGLSRIGKNPAFHLLYAVINVSVPMLAYECAGINNDTLSFLSFTVFALGLIRFAEKKRNYVTYVLIGAGVCLCFLSKLTAGMLAIIALALFLLYVVIKEKNVKFLISRQFLISLPFYLIAAGYYIYIKKQTGSFEPSYALLNPAQYHSTSFYTPQNRGTKGHRDYFKYFLSNFLYTWTGIVSHIALYKKGQPLYSPEKVGLISILLTPVFTFFRPFFNRWLRVKDTIVPAVCAMYISIASVFAIQLYHAYREFQYISGYLGGFQSRYYLCCIIVLAMAGVIFAKMLYGPEKSINTLRISRNSKHSAAGTVRHIAVNTFCLAFSAVLVYEDFIYFILNFNQYLS